MKHFLPTSKHPLKTNILTKRREKLSLCDLNYLLDAFLEDQRRQHWIRKRGFWHYSPWTSQLIECYVQSLWWADDLFSSNFSSMTVKTNGFIHTAVHTPLKIISNAWCANVMMRLINAQLFSGWCRHIPSHKLQYKLGQQAFLLCS